MDARAVSTFLARAAEATSVRDLHATVRALWRAHPADPDAERVERACWDRALGLFTGPGAGSLAPAPAPPARRDWKERAARMESAELLDPLDVA
jgi:hypothetical protein